MTAVNMIFGPCRSLWPGYLGPRSSLNNPEWLKGNDVMQEWYSESWVLGLTMPWTCCGNLGTSLPGFRPQFPSLCWGRSADVERQELWSGGKWTASFCSCVVNDITVGIWVLLGPGAIGKWVSHSLEDCGYQNHPGLSDHSWHHHATAVPYTQWVFSKCLPQECIRFSYGQKTPPPKTVVWTR